MCLVMNERLMQEHVPPVSMMAEAGIPSRETGSNMWVMPGGNAGVGAGGAVVTAVAVMRAGAREAGAETETGERVALTTGGASNEMVVVVAVSAVADK